MGPPSPSWASAIPGLWTGAQGTRLPRRVFGAGQDVPTPGVRAHPLGSPVPEPQGHRTHQGGVPAPGGGRAMPGRLGLAHGADAAGTKWTPRGPSPRGAGGQGRPRRTPSGPWPLGTAGPAPFQIRLLPPRLPRPPALSLVTVTATATKPPHLLASRPTNSLGGLGLLLITPLSKNAASSAPRGAGERSPAPTRKPPLPAFSS